MRVWQGALACGVRGHGCENFMGRRESSDFINNFTQFKEGAITVRRTPSGAWEGSVGFECWLGIWEQAFYV